MSTVPYYSYHSSWPPIKQTKRHRGRRFMRISVLLVAIIMLFCFGWENVATHMNGLTKGAAAAQVPVEDTQLINAWKAALVGNQGGVSIAVHDSKTGHTAQYATTTARFNTASIVKLSILEELLMQDQVNHTGGLTGDQLALATPMIENSDDNSASTLWGDVGGATAMNSFFQRIGATSTTAGSGGLWGVTQTTAPDQLKVMNAVAYPGNFLTNASAQAADSLMDNVESDQAWGVSAGSPNNVTVELKNGWLPDNETNDAYSASSTDWTMNSIGHVHGDGQDYTIAVLTMGDPGQGAGIATIQKLATVTWQIIANQSAASAGNAGA